ncbi:MAG: dihydroorotate dehydrogenase [Spirochaetia bacterium]|jgi:dihydroorotate dehydrogenase (NAD+) catalytic subunit|nr:dihydroorotate dehydrogenase [Spirochaetia bacterium]
MNNALQANLAGTVMKNPLLLASGTCGFGKELSGFFDIEKLGGMCFKGLTLQPQCGNEGIRIWETPSGLMNSIGLENPGVDAFIDTIYPKLTTFDFTRIVNLGGHSEEEYEEALEKLNDLDIDFIELNISCPNVKNGGMNFGIQTEFAKQFVARMRKICRKKMIVKLSPNAENIVDLAKACEEVGADALSLVNTFQAMAIDIKKKKPVFNNVYAGLSGPAIRPIALRMVHQVCHAVDIPVVAVGGIMSWEDVIAYIMVGATCCEIGTASLLQPTAAMGILKGLEQYMADNHYSSLDEIRRII